MARLHLCQIKLNALCMSMKDLHLLPLSLNA
jgi:hypothetical protein